MKIPTVNDDKLRVEFVSNGLDFPASMAFLGPEDILVLEKNEGTVQRIKDCKIFDEPVLDENVANKGESGMTGISISEQNGHTDVFLYYTEAKKEDGDSPIGNRLYKYQFEDEALVNRQLLLDLPATPGPSHDGGSIIIGPDNNIYIPIGDVGYQAGQISNNEEGLPPDGRGGILRVTQQGEAIETPANGDDEDDEDNGNEDDEEQSIDGILGDEDPLNKYFAYGIRNSFGIDFDPETGNLWDTENGPNYGDEINLVEPGFNSGWNKVQGIWEDNEGNSGDTLRSGPEGLVSFGGKGRYSPPELTWKNRVGATALKFLDSERLGSEYKNDIFVSNYHEGRIYHFDLDRSRTELLLSEPLQDKVVDGLDEVEKQIFGQDFGSITDMEVGTDGYLYILSVYDGKGALFRIIPKPI
jgi:glucose/arabinose dehydrogenase